MFLLEQRDVGNETDSPQLTPSSAPVEQLRHSLQFRQGQHAATLYVNTERRNGSEWVGKGSLVSVPVDATTRNLPAADNYCFVAAKCKFSTTKCTLICRNKHRFAAGTVHFVNTILLFLIK